MAKTPDELDKTPGEHDVREQHRGESRLPDHREVIRECLAEWLGRGGMAERLF